MESNKALAETIGKTTVHCLYHRSGCVWQGPLSECTTHCSGCAFGNSPVVCNRCGIQIVHRQVQEHAQTCNVNGTSTQPQTSEAAQDAASSGAVPTDQSKIANQAVAPPLASQPQASQTAAAQNLNQPATSYPLPQVMAAPVLPTAEHQYYQHYQQYYQQYPGYDPYQQAYQQYYPYQHQPAQQIQQPSPSPSLSHKFSSKCKPQCHRYSRRFKTRHRLKGRVNHNLRHNLRLSHKFQLMDSHPLYPSQPHQHAPPQQHPMQVQPPSGSLPSQFPPPPSYMRPLQPSHMFPPQQRPVTHQVQQPMPPPYIQQPQAFPGQTPGQLQGQPHHAGLSAHQNLQVRPQVPPQQMQQPSPALPHGMPPQSYVGRPAMLNQGGQPQQYPQSSGSAGVAPPARPLQFGSSQPFVSQSNVNLANQQYVYPDQQRNEYAPPSGGDQTFERRVEQEGKSPSLKKSEPVINEVKPEAGMADEFKREGGQRKDEALTKDAVSELHQAQGGVLVKEESTDGALEDHSLGQKKTHDSAVPTTDSAKQGEISGSFSQSQTPQGQIGEASGGFPSKGTEQSSHLAPITEQGRSTHPPLPYGPPGQQQRPVAPKSQSAPNIEQTMGQSPSHFRPPGHGYLPHGPHPGDQFQPPGPNQPPPFHPEVPSGGPNSFANSRGYEPHGRISRMSQGDPFGPPPPHGPDGLRHHVPMESDMYQNQRPSHFDSRRQDSHLPGNLDRGPYRPPYGAESNSTRMNGAPPPGFDSSSAPGFGDEKFRTSDSFPMPPNRHHEESFKQFPGPPHLGREDSPKFGSRPSGGYGMDGPSRFHEKEPRGYGYDAGQRLPPYHLNESGGRPLPANIHDNRGRFDNNRQNPDFLGPMHGFGRHHMDHLPPTSPGNPFGGPHNIDVDGRNMERQSFGERFPMGPPGHMHRGEYDGPGKPMNGEPFGPRDLSGRGEPGFGPFHDYGRLGEHGPGGFSHQSRFGEGFGSKSARPHLDEPVFRNSYSRQGFPSDGGFYAGGPDSFDPLMKRKTFSMGWCRICKVDCESVEGLDMHGQTREHQRMSMDMVISIKKKNAKRQKTSIEREEGSKYRI
ncbi:hypothetical protein HanHA300_Chr00c0164g0722851 [Helianthus annuus]|nr:hypothetical protein HanHA300_Chr00c0164g0722851 [Helianthus annuus]